MAGTAATGADERSLDHLVFAEQVALLHERFFAAQLAVVANAAIVTAIFWERSARLPSLLWLATLYAITAGRSLAVHAYRSRERGPSEARRWARIFVAGTAAAGAAWGASALVFRVPGSPAHQMFIAFVLGGMSAGAAASNASHLPAFAAFAVPALLPVTVRFAAERDPIHLAMAFMLAAFGLAITAISRTGSRAVANAIRLRLRNEALVARVTAAQQDLEALNTALEHRVAERTAELERILKLRLESEARLARFRALLDQVGDAVLVARADDLCVVDVNDGACALLGAPADALVERPLGAIGVAPSLEGAALRARLERLAPGDVRTFEDQRRRPRQPAQALELSMALREVEHQAYVLVVARDVSARKEMEGKLAEAGLLTSLGSLAAGVAHEINNPLACVLANLQHLSDALGARGDLPAAQKAPLQDVVRDSLEATRRASSIVRDLGALSPREQVQLEPIDVAAVLESCINVAMGDIRGRAALVRELGAVPLVLGDRTRLAQVFLNLLVNAAQAIPEGAPGAHRITVRARFDERERRVEVDVADTGAGISAQNLSRIFEPFFTTKPLGHGTGLGLSVCRGIVATLGGHIAVASREGEGSTFTVSLRPASGDLPTPRAPSSPAGGSNASERGARILIVDDEPGVARALRRALVQNDVTIAIGGAAAVAALEGRDFDVVLCDVMMPDVSGIDVHRRLASLRPGAELAIVFVTGGTFTEGPRTFLESVPNARLTKPFEVEDVRAAVRRALALRPPRTG